MSRLLARCAPLTASAGSFRHLSCVPASWCRSLIFVLLLFCFVDRPFALSFRGPSVPLLRGLCSEGLYDTSLRQAYAPLLPMVLVAARIGRCIVDAFPSVLIPPLAPTPHSLCAGAMTPHAWTQRADVRCYCVFGGKVRCVRCFTFASRLVLACCSRCSCRFLPLSPPPPLAPVPSIFPFYI